MSDLIETLYTLARRRGDESNPLIAVHRFASREGARISHLAIDPNLAQAWIRVTGEPFRPHQSLAWSALRRGEPLALVGGVAVRRSLSLLMLAWLREAMPATGLVLVPDEGIGREQHAVLEELARPADVSMRVGITWGTGIKTAPGAAIVVATPQALHERLLRYHDRAWAGFWARLGLIAVVDGQRYSGLAASHLAGLLMRARRLSGGIRPPLLMANIAPVRGVASALEAMSGETWRIIRADDGTLPAATLAFWRVSTERVPEAVSLALDFAQVGARVHLLTAPLEEPLAHALIGSDAPGVSIGVGPQAAQVQIMSGVAYAAASLHQCLETASLTVMLLADDPAERTIARLVARETQPQERWERAPLLDAPPPCWIAAPMNAYIIAQHLVCAASERALGMADVTAWGAEALVAKLEDKGALVRLPELDPAWQPGRSGEDPYADFDLDSAATPPVRVCDERGRAIGALSVALFDRWGFGGAALPPLRGGYRVLERNDAELSLSVRALPEARRTLPLRRCQVQVRDSLGQRLIGKHTIAWGRVIVDEEVYGWRETADATVHEESLAQPLAARWSAPAVWIDLPMTLDAERQLIGWSLAAALPLHTLATVSDLAPAYDAEARRLYFVDAQPGGNGLAAWLFQNLEEVLPTAYALALDGCSDPLFSLPARADMDWMLALLGSGLTPPPAESAMPALDSARREATQPADPLIEASDRREEAMLQDAACSLAPATASSISAEAPIPPPHRADAPQPGRASRSLRRTTAAAARKSAASDRPMRPSPAIPSKEAAATASPPDAAALAARLRQIREERQQRSARSDARRSPVSEHHGTLRFQAGDVIICIPYGQGAVLESRWEEGREVLRVHFPGHGELTIDPVVSLARLAHDKTSDDRQ